jgi:hypothetical protein
MLVLGWIVLVALFAGAGLMFVIGHLKLNQLRREGADVPGLQTGRMSREWRRFRHPHLPPNREDQARMQEVVRANGIAVVLLLAALGLFVALQRVS